ncbi:MAG: M50 family metallopeptidase [Clostridia bacterium]
MIFSIVITILALGFMVCLHELGHMIAAKSFGVLVHEFSIGMGPKLFSVKPKETSYSLRLLPIGGFVQMEGETDPEDGEPLNPRSFKLLKPWKKFIVLAAGATLNIILGLALFTVINANTYVTPPVVDSIIEECADTTAFMEGDEILRIENTRIHSQKDISMCVSDDKIQNSSGVEVLVRRNGQKLRLSVTLTEIDGYKFLGVRFKPIVRPGLFTSFKYAVYDTEYVVKAVINAVGDLITGQQNVNSLSGPVEIVTVVDQVAQEKTPYTWLNLMMLFAMITVNLGVFNLLPIPALDGGQILFVLIEKITGREIKPNVVGVINSIFFALLMLLAVYVTVGDVIGLIK